MSIGAIPITKVHLYAEQHGVLNVDLFERIILDIDQEYLTLIAKKQEK